MDKTISGILIVLLAYFLLPELPLKSGILGRQTRRFWLGLVT